MVGLRHRTQVRWVHAPLLSAVVMQHKPSRKRSVDTDPRPAMDTGEALLHLCLRVAVRS